MDDSEDLFVFMLSLKMMSAESVLCYHRKNLIGRHGEKAIEGQGEKVHGIGKEQYEKNNQKKNGVEDSRLTIKRVTEKMKNNKECCDDVAQEKKRVEESKNKAHNFIFTLTLLFYHRGSISTTICLGGREASSCRDA